MVEYGCRHRHGVMPDGFEAQVAPDLRARLPFQALSFKLAGQMPVMQIRSLVSKGVISPEMVFGPAAPAPLSLEELRHKTQETVTGALQQIQGWRDRAELMQCLNSVVPLERLSSFAKEDFFFVGIPWVCLFYRTSLGYPQWYATRPDYNYYTQSIPDHPVTTPSWPQRWILERLCGSLATYPRRSSRNM